MIQRIKDDLRSVPFWVGFGFLLLITLMTSMLGQDLPERSQLAGSAIMLVCISWWLVDDAQRMHFVLPMGYGMLLLFFTPIFAPIYLFQTRGPWAVVSIGLYLFSGICILAAGLFTF